MVIADKAGLPVSAYVDSASPHEVTLVAKTLTKRFTRKNPKRLVADRAYDSDPLDKQLHKRKIDLIAPHKVNRRKKQTQDGRKLRRYKRRWIVERLNAWLQSFRKITTRYEYKAINYANFVFLACTLILLRNYF